MKAPPLLISDRDPWPEADARRLRGTASSLKRAAARGSPRPLLQGKKLALLCDKPRCGCTSAFADAATALGAHVSRIHTPDLSPETGRLLGQLYDAIGCEHLADATVNALLRLAEGLPVFVGLGRADHPVMTLLEPGSTDEDRLFLCQALLVSTIG
jgi:ornithine carbamoyltransferase